MNIKMSVKLKIYKISKNVCGIKKMFTNLRKHLRFKKNSQIQRMFMKFKINSKNVSISNFKINFDSKKCFYFQKMFANTTKMYVKLKKCS